MTPTPAVGVICLRGAEVLLIRRANPPLQGHWSLPGGRIQPGVAVRDAALRELAEETGVQADLLGVADVVDAVFPEQDRHYVLIDFAARWKAGEPRPGDDASEAGFFTLEQALARVKWEPTRRLIAEAFHRFGS